MGREQQRLANWGGKCGSAAPPQSQPPPSSLLGSEAQNKFVSWKLSFFHPTSKVIPSHGTGNPVPHAGENKGATSTLRRANHQTPVLQWGQGASAVHAWHKHHQETPAVAGTNRPPHWEAHRCRTEGAESRFVSLGEDLELRECPESPGFQKQTISKPWG